MNGRKVSPTVLEKVRLEAGLKDFTTTKEHVIVERNLARTKLKDTIKVAETLREKELRKREEDAATEGDEKTTISYETLIEHEKSRSKWRKIKFYLNSGDTEPLTRLLVTKNGQQKVLTDGAEIQEAVINHNTKHFSEAENTPLGMGTLLHDAIGPHGTSGFCNRVLDGGLGKADKEDINSVEAYKLLQHMQRKKQIRRRFPVEWIKDTSHDLLTSTTTPENIDSESESDEEPEASDPEAPWQEHPYQQPEIGLNITREELRKGFKLWTKPTAISPSGRHLGHYKVLVQDDGMEDFLITQMELPLQYGFDPTRWANALQTMIPKDQGMPKVERIRVRQLFEVDYNFVLRIIWGRRLVWSA